MCYMKKTYIFKCKNEFEVIIKMNQEKSFPYSAYPDHVVNLCHKKIEPFSKSKKLKESKSFKS